MILLIDNYDSFTYNLYQSILPFYPDVYVVRNDRITLHEIKELPLAGIILSPGPGRPENAGICLELMRALPAKIPLLGVCLGLQIIVKALGGDIIQAPEIMHGKHETIFHNRKGIYEKCPLPFQAGRYHSLMADKKTLPQTLLIDAENAKGVIMGIRHRQLPIFGVQFHPESILTPVGTHLLHNFIKHFIQSRAPL